MCHELTAHTAALKDFLSAAPEEMVLKCGASFSSDRRHILIDYFGKKHLVSLQDGEVKTALDETVSFNDATLILQYLKQCSGLPPRGKWLSFLELPEGILHHVPFLNDACNPLAETFGHRLELFKQLTGKLGATRIQMGDTAVCVPVFTKLPLAAAIWEGDDEFPARAVILFDSIAQHQLTTAALWVLGCELTSKLQVMAEQK